MKTCKKCGVVKEFSLFGKQKANKDGLSSWCKQCTKEYMERYAKTYTPKVTDELREQRRLNIVRYRKENPGYNTRHVIKYLTKRSGATPEWLSQEQKDAIASMYAEARRLTEETGEQHHVDHIVPVQGKNISGLHVPWNLQVLTAAENWSKSNN